jgi:energy-coupling factor transport system permease protein
VSRPLDPRAWLLWLVAASLPALIGRNPFVLVAVLMTVLGVRAAWATTPRFAAWRIVVRLALLFAAISVLFNLFTVHVGDRVIGELPALLPIIGGILTLNALIYGLLSGLALLTLVLAGTTLGAVLDWMTLLRLLPPRLATLAVAGSVAWALVPQTLVAATEIREAQQARGHRPRGVRDVAPLLVPLLAGSLERSFVLAEALEARGFGSQPVPTAWPWGKSVLMVTGLAMLVTAAYILVVGKPAPAGVLFVAGAAAVVVGTRSGDGAAPTRTRFREPVWDRPEWVVSLASVAVLAVEIALLAVDPAAFAFDPYPTLTPPVVNLGLLAALGLLLAPAAVAR